MSANTSGPCDITGSHRVIFVAGADAFVVVSGRSGRRYLVEPLPNGVDRCSCKAGRHARPCSHREAVWRYLEEQATGACD